MKKIIGITSGKGVGKTQAAAYFAKPSEIGSVLYFDTEDSTSDVIRQLDELGLSFGTHVRMYERLLIEQEEQDDILSSLAKGQVPWTTGAGKRNLTALAGYFDYFLLRLDEALREEVDGKPKHKILVIDTMGQLLAGMVAMVEKNPSKFGWSGTTAYGKLEVEGVRPLWENMFEGCAQRGIEWIILTSHIKSVWHEKKPVPNKVKPGGRQKLLARLAAQWYWLVKEPANANGAPAAIKLKGRLGRLDVDKKKDEWIQQGVLPERIPNFTWPNVWAYLDAPADLANPAPGERMSEEEADMVSEFLNEAQMALMMAATEATKYQEQARAKGITSAIPVKRTKPEDNIAQVVEMLEKEPKVAAGTIAAELKVPVPVAVSLLAKVKGEK